MSNSYEILANQPIVIDNGSGTIKAGFAGETKPKVVFPNIVGRPKFSRAMAGALEGDMFIGESARRASAFKVNVSCIGSKAQTYRGLMAITYPMEHGIVENWSDMEAIWTHIYSQEQVYPHFTSFHFVFFRLAASISQRTSRTSH